ncbi:hypothetical protein DFP72DRAFT_1067060 [Ephemerocybe angulata]|uniref:Uncharacterized protein n=1 Tax=Ephemerocybe angulata TaxID=980116 RepID=A0A8H6M9P2_9AGAR|nr:hypothetical protein DFP72DRAFT_1067060 [Tulosesus angulatus]
MVNATNGSGVPKPSGDWVRWVIVGVAAFVLIFFTLCYLKYTNIKRWFSRRRQGRKRAAQNHITVIPPAPDADIPSPESTQLLSEKEAQAREEESESSNLAHAVPPPAYLVNPSVPRYSLSDYGPLVDSPNPYHQSIPLMQSSKKAEF